MKKSIYSQESNLLRLWLTNQRKKKRLTQRQLASLLGIHHSIIGKIETGERQINVVELIWYCKTLGVDPVDVINRLQLMD